MNQKRNRKDKITMAINAERSYRLTHPSGAEKWTR